MLGGCGITSWQSNSQVVHATAPTPLGPWRREPGVTLHVWAHCPNAAVAPDGTVILPRLWCSPRKCVASTIIIVNVILADSRYRLPQHVVTDSLLKYWSDIELAQRITYLMYMTDRSAPCCTLSTVTLVWHCHQVPTRGSGVVQGRSTHVLKRRAVLQERRKPVWVSTS